jgi:hypothetical protein
MIDSIQLRTQLFEANKGGGSGDGPLQHAQPGVGPVPIGKPDEPLSADPLVSPVGLSSATPIAPPLPYFEETVLSPQGFLCQVLNTNGISWDGAHSGRKTSQTLVRRAWQGETLETKNTAGKIESVYRAQRGEAIFVNPHNPDDQYVPGTPSGERMKFSDLVTSGYRIVAVQENGDVTVQNDQSFKILHEVVKQPTCIKDAWGPGQHQFLYPGASLKLAADNIQVTGIDKEAFDKTWELVVG